MRLSPTFTCIDPPLPVNVVYIYLRYLFPMSGFSASKLNVVILWQLGNQEPEVRSSLPRSQSEGFLARFKRTCLNSSTSTTTQDLTKLDTSPDVHIQGMGSIKDLGYI
ncbi:hypothetical protein KP79_PYT10882 [Mizuhopecten yessoensis]|uniref:Uncharacterized protein n=1 Tax=Mizuhopecten yessoensis TaxID=6573 RepID=A0A210Q289_MIZYE|nr:hypothetical protein KP79_PYT10882 [Mizuhopecten yessoensis]